MKPQLNGESLVARFTRDPHSSAPTSGQLLNQPRDAERELTGEAIQPTATENTALKQSVRELSAGTAVSPDG